MEVVMAAGTAFLEFCQGRIAVAIGLEGAGESFVQEVMCSREYDFVALEVTMSELAITV